MIVGGGVAALESLVACARSRRWALETVLVAPGEHFSIGRCRSVSPSASPTGPALRVATLCRQLDTEFVRDEVVSVDSPGHSLQLGLGRRAALRHPAARRRRASAYPAFEARRHLRPRDRCPATSTRCSRRPARGSRRRRDRRARRGDVALPAYELALLPPATSPARGSRSSPTSRRRSSAFGRRERPRRGPLDGPDHAAHGRASRVARRPLCASAGTGSRPPRRRAPAAVAAAHAPACRRRAGLRPRRQLRARPRPRRRVRGRRRHEAARSSRVASRRSRRTPRHGTSPGASARASRSSRSAPVLRGLLLTRDGPRYLRAELEMPTRSTTISAEPLWWPPSKIASRWLAPYLEHTTRAEAGLVAARD